MSASASVPQKVKEHPPDASLPRLSASATPYEVLRDPRRRALHMFFSPIPVLLCFFGCRASRQERKFTGADPWLASLREK